MHLAMELHALAVEIYALAVEIYALAVEIYALAVEIYALAMEIYALAVEIYALAVEIYALAVEIYALAVEIYALAMEIYALAVEIYALAVEIYALAVEMPRRGTCHGMSGAAFVSGVAGPSRRTPRGRAYSAPTRRGPTQSPIGHRFPSRRRTPELEPFAPSSPSPLRPSCDVATSSRTQGHPAETRAIDGPRSTTPL